jgi:serine/threonine protein kinase
MADPKVVGSWTVVRKLGEGGQGAVYLARSPRRQMVVDQGVERLAKALQPRAILGTATEHAQAFLAALRDVQEGDDGDELGAAKVFERAEGDEGRKARARLEQEVAALKQLAGQPGIIRLLDSDVPSGHIVMEFCPGGSLEGSAAFKGDVQGALRAFRQIVAAAATLHSAGYVHRDIKTANILLDGRGRFVLGDFGIIFREEAPGARITDSLERVGTRDWMPPWAHKIRRIEDVRPSFDVFSLGKLLWCMVSGERFLPYWGWDDDDNALASMFPENRHVWAVNQLLAKTVVQKEAQCLPDAGQLLQLVDESIRTLDGGGQDVGPGIVRTRGLWATRMCGFSPQSNLND